MPTFKIIYDGEYPNLCSGTLTVDIDGKKWKFPDYCLSSCGSCSVYADGEEVTRGPWYVKVWPVGFPEDMKEAATDAINDQIPHGCCGGCI